MIEKALCGPHMSGARFHANFADAMRMLDFMPAHADSMFGHMTLVMHVVVCINDVLTMLKDPDFFHKELQSDLWNHKLKNVEEPNYHLGGDFVWDEDGTLCHGTQTHVRFCGCSLNL